MKFNIISSLGKDVIPPLETGGYFEKITSFEEYVALTKQAALESVGQSGNLFFNLEILLILDRYSKFFSSEFTETQDEEFKEIKEIFFRGLWSNEAVYVGYGEDLAQLEWDLNIRDQHGINQWKMKKECKWRIYVLRKQRDDQEAKYQSLITGIPLNIPEDMEKLIEVKWDENYTLRFLSWWKIAVNMYEYEQIYFKLSAVAVNRVLINAPDENVRKYAEKVLLNCSPVLHNTTENIAHMTGFEAKEFLPMADLPLFFDSMTQWFYFNAGQLGFTGNVSDKADRMTTGEHIKDLKTVVNSQQCTLEHLESFAKKAKEKWSKDLQFQVTSSMGMDGSNIQINNGQTPQGPDNNMKPMKK